jgi:hypothetical protein
VGKSAKSGFYCMNGGGTAMHRTYRFGCHEVWFFRFRKNGNVKEFMDFFELILYTLIDAIFVID